MNPLIKDFKKSDVMNELKKRGFNRQQRRDWYRKHCDDEVRIEEKPKLEVRQNRGVK
jgi:hypothetical protein